MSRFIFACPCLNLVPLEPKCASEILYVILLFIFQRKIMPIVQRDESMSVNVQELDNQHQNLIQKLWLIDHIQGQGRQYATFFIVNYSSMRSRSNRSCLRPVWCLFFINSLFPMKKTSSFPYFPVDLSSQTSRKLTPVIDVKISTLIGS